MGRSLQLPGFFDIQINGFAGVDFNAPGVTEDAIAHVTARLRARGVTRYLPTFITGTLDHFRQCVAPWVQSNAAAVAGFHLEGPYINPDEGPRGAHELAYCVPPSIEDFQRRQDAANGRVRLMTLAPELPGALALIEHLVREGVRVAIGHSAANMLHIRDAVAAGASLSTHLGNAGPRLVPRFDNVIWQQLAADGLSASLIVDGHHLAPETVKVMVRAKTPARTVLVTDAMAAAGMPPGAYTLGDIHVTLDASGRAVRDTGRLAGSALTLDRAVALTARFAQLDVEQAAAMASVHPAALLGERPVGNIDATWDAERFHLTVVGVRDDDVALG